MGEEVEITVKRKDVKYTLRGTREGIYARLPTKLLAFHPAVRAALRKEHGKELNNVWVVIQEDSGELIRPDQVLRANIRISKRTGGFVIAAGVVIGAVAAIETIEAIKRTHQAP